jgi:hypothetical protein
MLPEHKLVRADSDSGEPLGTKLGGTPDFIQAEWQPECCGEKMVFLGQLDSLDIPEAKLPDSAIVYVFYCRKCMRIAASMQCC